MKEKEKKPPVNRIKVKSIKIKDKILVLKPKKGFAIREK